MKSILSLLTSSTESASRISVGATPETFFKYASNAFSWVSPSPTKYSPLNAAPTAAIVPIWATTPPAPAVYTVIK